MKNSITLILSIALLGIIESTQAQVVTPAPNFGTNGVVISDFFAKDDVANDMVRQSDGKIVVTGYSVENSHKTFMVARYKTDGTPDSTFGINGRINAWYVNANNTATSVALQSDGKIVIAGYFDNNFYNDPVVVRFNSNGAPDVTFGTGGFATFFLSNQFDEFHDIAIQNDGKILATGRTFENNSYNFLTVRLLSSGALDPSFGTNGKVTTDINGGYDCAYSILIQPDDKILVSGNSEPGSSYFAAARYMANGTPDLTFGVAGKASYNSGSRFDKAYGMALQADSSIVMVGTHHNNTLDEYMIIRTDKFGVLDNTFGVNGYVYLPTTDATDGARDVVIQNNGKIVISGNGQGNKALLIRLNQNGTTDNTFGTQGMYSGNVAGANSTLNSLILLPDQSIVACGSAKPGNNFDFLVTKLLVNTSTGLETPKQTTFETKIYPNPASESINIQFYNIIDKPGTIAIYDNTGRVFLKQDFGFLYPPIKLALPEHLPSGVYYLDIRTADKSSVGKFMVK